MYILRDIKVDWYICLNIYTQEVTRAITAAATAGRSSTPVKSGTTPDEGYRRGETTALKETTGSTGGTGTTRGAVNNEVTGPTTTRTGVKVCPVHAERTHRVRTQSTV